MYVETLIESRGPFLIVDADGDVSFKRRSQIDTTIDIPLTVVNVAQALADGVRKGNSVISGDLFRQDNEREPVTPGRVESCSGESGVRLRERDRTFAARGDSK